MATALAGAAGDTISKLLLVHSESVPGLGGGRLLDATAGNANPGQGGEVDFGGGLPRHEHDRVEKSGVEIIVLLSTERHARFLRPSPTLSIPATRPLFSGSARSMNRVSASATIPILYRLWNFPFLDKKEWRAAPGQLEAAGFHNSAGLLYHKVQQLMAQVFAETPLGACRVSSEGACAAYYRYGRYQEAA